MPYWCGYDVHNSSPHSVELACKQVFIVKTGVWSNRLSMQFVVHAGCVAAVHAAKEALLYLLYRSRVLCPKMLP